MELSEERLRNQRLTRSAFRVAEEVVAWLGAVQAQDYSGAKWAVGQRAKGLTDGAVEQAFAEGTILRTHILRPTWHFVTPADIRWMLELSAPRVHAANAHYYRKVGLDGRTFARSRKALERALQGETHRTRSELAVALQRAGIPADGMRLAYLMMHAELEGAICSGPRRGKQFIYALIDERVPQRKPRSRDEALAVLTERYFTGHGPATVRDYVWWSGLTVREAKAGIEMVGRALERDVIGERTYWSAASRSPAPRASPSVHLLPIYDEYLIAYKDRGPVAGSPDVQGVAPQGRDAWAHWLIVDGRYAGIWRRTLKAGAVSVDAVPYRPLTPAHARALAAAAQRYGRFLGVGSGARTLTTREVSTTLTRAR